MDKITQVEIENEIMYDDSRELSLIPIILIIFGSLIALAITFLLLAKGPVQITQLEFLQNLSGETAQTLGYIGLLILTISLLYNYSFRRKEI